MDARKQETDQIFAKESIHLPIFNLKQVQTSLNIFLSRFAFLSSYLLHFKYMPVSSATIGVESPNIVPSSDVRLRSAFYQSELEPRRFPRYSLCLDATSTEDSDIKQSRSSP